MQSIQYRAWLLRLRSFRLFLFYVITLAWLPFTQALAQISGDKTPMVAVVTIYKAEVIIVACVFMLALGSILSLRYEPPSDVPQGSRMDKLTRFLFSIAGGIVAFIYILEQKQSLTLLHPVWVLGVSIVTPSFVQIAFPIIVSMWYKFVKNKERKIGDDES